MKTLMLFFTLSLFYSFSLSANAFEFPVFELDNIDKIESTEYSFSMLNANTTCLVEGCCDDVTVTSTPIGYNAQGCCMFRIETSNSSSCELYLFNDKGNSLPPIPPYSNHTFTWWTCPGITGTLFVGTSLDPDDACWTQSFECEPEEEDCCEKISAQLNSEGYDSDGCCKYSVDVVNESGCPTYIIDQDGNASGPNSATSYTYNVTVCFPDVMEIHVSPTNSLDDACWSKAVYCEEEDDCCEDITVSSSSTDFGVCCRHEIRWINTSDCPIYLIDQWGNVNGPQSGTSGSFVFFTCHSWTRTYSISPTPDIADACWTETFGCDSGDADSPSNSDIRTNEGSSMNIEFKGISPNPFNDYVQFNVVTDMNEPFTLSIMSVEGRVIKTITGNTENGENNISIEGLSDLPANMYFIHFESAGQTIYEKIVKQ